MIGAVQLVCDNRQVVALIDQFCGKGYLIGFYPNAIGVLGAECQGGRDWFTADA